MAIPVQLAPPPMYLGNNAQYQPFINAIAGQKFKAAMMGLGGSPATPLYDQQRAAMTDSEQPGQVGDGSEGVPVGDPAPGAPTQPTKTQKSARMPNSFKGLGF